MMETKSVNKSLSEQNLEASSPKAGDDLSRCEVVRQSGHYADHSKTSVQPLGHFKKGEGLVGFHGIKVG